MNVGWRLADGTFFEASPARQSMENQKSLEIFYYSYFGIIFRSSCGWGGEWERRGEADDETEMSRIHDFNKIYQKML